MTHFDSLGEHMINSLADHHELKLGWVMGHLGRHSAAKHKVIKG